MAESNGKRVLVVDDAALLRRFYRVALEAAGFEVLEALNGIEALEKLLAETVDLLIVDINMPQMDGITFLRELRALELPAASTPALVTSSESGPQDIAAARSAGANFYLVKPASREQIAAYASLLAGAQA